MMPNHGTDQLGEGTPAPDKTVCRHGRRRVAANCGSTGITDRCSATRTSVRDENTGNDPAPRNNQARSFDTETVGSPSDDQAISGLARGITVQKYSGLGRYRKLPRG